MTTYSEHEQRQLDTEFNENWDRERPASPPPLPVREEGVDFFLVWTKRGHSPRFIHHNEERAVAEAQRLAREHPTKKFIVLHATRKFSVDAKAMTAEAYMAGAEMEAA